MTTRERLVALVEARPGITATDLVPLLGVSRQRVSIILRQQKIKLSPARIYTGPYCSECDKRTPKNQRGVCHDCYMAARPPVEFICDICGRPFTVPLREVRHRERRGITSPHFCSHQCWGVVAGNMYGFAAHPENRASGNNRYKTHCKHGHAFDEANTYHPPGNPSYRTCRACGARRHNEAYARKKKGE